MKVIVSDKKVNVKFKPYDFFITAKNELRQIVPVDDYYVVVKIPEGEVITRHHLARNATEGVQVYVDHNGPVRKVNIVKVETEAVGTVERSRVE